MAHDHTYPEALETLLTRLPELELVLGPSAKPGLQSVQLLLQEAVAARADGDVPRAMRRIANAMDMLAQLADTLDPHEAMLMRALSAQFRRALLRGDQSEVQRTSDAMREKSGTTVKSKR
jgi:hypothetical protein